MVRFLPAIAVGIVIIGAALILVWFATDNSTARLAGIGCQVVAAGLMMFSTRRTGDTSR